MYACDDCAQDAAVRSSERRWQIVIVLLPFARRLLLQAARVTAVVVAVAN
jgi:hypothetical protein